jgi:hypothetical protein
MTRQKYQTGAIKISAVQAKLPLMYLIPASIVWQRYSNKYVVSLNF